MVRSRVVLHNKIQTSSSGGFPIFIYGPIFPPILPFVAGLTIEIIFLVTVLSFNYLSLVLKVRTQESQSSSSFLLALVKRRYKCVLWCILTFIQVFIYINTLSVV